MSGANLLKQHWSEARPMLRQQWAQITDEDLTAIDGDFEYLVQTLVARCGYAADRAQREAHVFVARLGASADETAALFAVARETLAPGARKVREGLEELTAGVRILAKEAAARGGERLSATAGVAGERLRDTAGDVKEQGQVALERTENFIRERPFTAIGIAFLAGYLVLGRR